MLIAGGGWCCGSAEPAPPPPDQSLADRRVARVGRAALSAAAGAVAVATDCVLSHLAAVPLAAYVPRIYNTMNAIS